jgi:hypothetical protein
LARSRVVDFTGSWLDAPLAFLALPVLPAQGSNLFTWLLPFTRIIVFIFFPQTYF